jgi:hypothetical protein
MHRPFRSASALIGLATLLALGACSFNLFGGQSEPAPGSQPQAAQSASDLQQPLPQSQAPKADVDTSKGPLGLEPLGGPASPASQLMAEGTLGYLLDHLFGGTATSGSLSRAMVPQPAFSTTTAGGVPGGLWPGNWWIQGQGGGYNLTHLP